MFSLDKELENIDKIVDDFIESLKKEVLVSEKIFASKDNDAKMLYSKIDLFRSVVISAKSYLSERDDIIGRMFNICGLYGIRNDIADNTLNEIYANNNRWLADRHMIIAQLMANIADNSNNTGPSGKMYADAFRFHQVYVQKTLFHISDIRDNWDLLKSILKSMNNVSDALTYCNAIKLNIYNLFDGIIKIEKEYNTTISWIICGYNIDTGDTLSD